MNDELKIEIEYYIFVILQMLESDYLNFFNILVYQFPLIIKLDYKTNKETKTGIWVNKKMIVDFMANLLKDKPEVLADIEARISLRYFQEENPETFGDEKKTLNKTTPLEQAKDIVGRMRISERKNNRIVTPEQYQARMLHCNACPHWDISKGVNSGRCQKCDCSGAKQWIASSVCPINIWGPIT